MMATFQGSLDVYFNPSGLANILSLKIISDLWRVTMDSTAENAIFVHFPTGVWKFVKFGVGLYYYDTRLQSNFDKYSVNQYSFVSTVEDNKLQFHRREVERAELARQVHARIGRPPQRMFEKILQSGYIRNCPITVDDARRAYQIFGPDVSNLKGKMAKKSSSPASSFTPLSLPSYILQNHGKVTLCVDFFFVQGLGFIHTISRKIPTSIIELVRR